MSLESYQKIIQVLPVPTLLISGDGMVLAANAAARDLLGAAPGVVVADRPLCELVTDDPQAVRRYLDLCRRGQQFVPGRLTRRGTDSGLPLRCDAAAVEPRTASAPGVLLMQCRPAVEAARQFTLLNRQVADLTTEVAQRRLAEAALRGRERLLRSILDNSPGIIYIKAADGRLLMANRQFAELTGRPAEQIIGRHDFEVFGTGEHVRQIIENDRQVLAGDEVKQFEETLELADGPHTYLSLKVPLEESGFPGRVLCGISTDITELRRSREQAEAASRAKDHFLAVLSHELRTPLTPVLAAAQMLEDDPKLAPEVREVVTMIRRNAELEATLIDDLLDLTRISRGKIALSPREIDVHEKVRHVLRMCGPDIEAKKLRTEVDLGAGRATLFADAARTQQVLWNLIKNAVKFTPEGGTVGVRTATAGGCLRIEVWDTGVGIEAHMLPRIFDAFEQGGRAVTRQFGGLGLGLAITRSLVQLHGGTITAASDGKDRGATFTVELPLTMAPPRLAPEPKADGNGQATPAAGQRILLVEDNADTAGIMRRLLERGGHRVETAGSVAAALRAAAAERFDLLISDIGLPDGSGLDLMRQLLVHYPLKGIALSGYGMEDDVQRSRAAGFDEHLTKPISMQQLQTALARMRGQPVSQTGLQNQL